MPDSPVPDANPTSTTSVTVRVVYLARLREAFGCVDESLDIEGDAPTVAGVLATLRKREGVWARELAAGRAVRIAVNHQLVPADAPIRDGDEVALLPPVTGG
jgi:molybdopterin synthase sulfur carrier subunit